MTSDSNISLGDFLRQEREKRGITIEQVASATKVGVRILQALESDHYADLPAKPFIRGFVTSYARFIGLDPQELLSRFDSFIDLKAQDRPSREAGHSGYAFEKRETEQSRTVLWVVMGSFVVLGGLAMFIIKPSFKQHRATNADKLRAVHSTSAVPSAAPSALPSTLPSITPSVTPSATPSVKPSVKPSATPSATPSAAPSDLDKPDPLNSGANIPPSEIKYKAIFKAHADVWVRYQADDRPVMKFPLRATRLLVLRARNIIRFQASNPKSITFTVAGRSSKFLNEEKNIVQHSSGASLIVPFDHASKNTEPFPGEKALPVTPAPSPSPSP